MIYIITSLIVMGIGLVLTAEAYASDGDRSPISAQSALERLKKGNARYMQSIHNPGDVSIAKRESLFEAQHPYAVILSCSDSRVVPEDIFSTGIGELFVVRVAGNVLGEHELGSVEYAAMHLGANLIVVMGHEKCGAIGAAIGGHAEGYIQTIVDAIKPAIGDERDAHRASVANACFVAREIERRLNIQPDGPIKVMSAYYNLHGEVDFHG